MLKLSPLKALFKTVTFIATAQLVYFYMGSRIAGDPVVPREIAEMLCGLCIFAGALFGWSE
jgi:hypothetical protein